MAPTISDIYDALFDRLGPQHWWPGETPFEVMVGAVLTQNTNWHNVSQAIANLKEAHLLSFGDLSALAPEIIALHIRPAGYYNLKAGRLKNLLDFIVCEYHGNLEDFFDQGPGELRRQLLSVKGIGPETADSIVLYAAKKPVFVVDAYTHRILVRHGLIDEYLGYDEIQALFLDSLPEDVSLYNEYHALLVRVGKEFCKKKNPRCDQCPLKEFEPLLD